MSSHGPTVPTLLGNLGSPTDVTVDGTGLVSTTTWSLDWVVSAGDRWLEPAASAGSGTAVSQHRVDGTPVLETSLRVPGGQLVHHVWCAHTGGVEVVVVEVENRSPDAVGVGLLLDPHGAKVEFDGERAASVGSRPGVAFGRVPARVAVGAAKEVRATVTAGSAPAREGASLGAALGAVFPLAHTARLRVVGPVGGAEGWAPPADLESLPGPDEVARGWRSHLDAGVRLLAPDAAFVEAVDAARAGLLVAHDRDRPLADTAWVGLALGLWGHGDAAGAALADIVEHQRLDGGFGDRRHTATTALVLFALATWTLTPQGRALSADDLGDLAGPVAKAAHRMGRRHRSGDLPPWFATAQHAAAVVLDRAGQPDAAELCRERIDGTHPSAVLHEVALAVPPLDTVAGPDALAAARFLVESRRFLVDDTEPGLVRLVTRFPDEWLGQDLEVHRLPTGAGTLSFAVRWHGARPALLWELDPLDPGAPTTVFAGLDPDWSDERPVGEALLGPVEPAGGLPKVVAPLAGEGTPAAEASGDEASFS